MEFKRAKISEVKVDGDGRTIVGYAAAFGNVDRVKDVIEPGAFAKTISENRRIKVGYNHFHMIGRPMDMVEDEKGLLTESRISDTPTGNEVLQLVKDGVVDAMSIAYEVVKAEDDNDGVRRLKELRLYEYGPVDFPANENALIGGVKQFAYDLEHGQSLTPAALQEVKTSLGKLMRAIETLSEPEESTQSTEPTTVTQLKLVPPDWLNEIAESMKTRQEAYHVR